MKRTHTCHSSKAVSVKMILVLFTYISFKVVRDRPILMAEIQFKIESVDVESLINHSNSNKTLLKGTRT